MGRMESPGGGGAGRQPVIYTASVRPYALYHNGTILFILLSILVFYADRPHIPPECPIEGANPDFAAIPGVFSDTILDSVVYLAAHRLLGISAH
jgi:hypothetical protein